MASIRQLGACIGLPREFSLLGHFFGYASAPPWNLASSQALLPQVLSLKTQVQRLKKKHFHLNGIRVGTGSNGRLSPLEEQSLDCAVQVTREIYAAFGIGIGRFERWWHVPAAKMTGFAIIDNDDEAAELVDRFTVPNDGIDCFLVDDFIEDKVGRHPHKSDGVLVELRMDFVSTARTMAHELGHILGLGHENGKPSNLMCQSEKAWPMPNSAGLESDQIAEIRGDGHVKGPCA